MPNPMKLRNMCYKNETTYGKLTKSISLALRSELTEYALLQNYQYTIIKLVI